MADVTTVRGLLAEQGVTLRDLAYRYSEGCWRDGWKKGKEAALVSDEKPFMGGPQVLLDRGITELEGVDGRPIAITKLTRIRVKNLSEAALKQLGLERFYGDKGNEGEDVVHQEYVATFKENVENDIKHLLNNMVSAAAVMDTVASFVFDETTTLEAAATLVEEVLGGAKSEAGKALQSMLVVSNRAAWIGRACQDGSWKDSSDFKYHHTLWMHTGAIDKYVVRPVMEQFLRDLRAGNFKS